MLNQISKAAFAEQVKTKFRAQAADLPAFDLELTEVAEYTASPVIEQFSLFFLGPPEAPAWQGMYHLTHDQLGALEVFLVPVGRDQAGVRYEAVFNRFLK